MRYQLRQYALAKEDFEQLRNLPKQETSTVYFRQPAFGVGVDQIFTTQSSGKDHLFNWLGLTETQLGNYSFAICYFDSALRLHPKEADYFVNRGIAFQRDQQVSKAILDFKKALALNPHQATAKYNLSLLSTGDSSKEAMLDSALSDNATLPYIYAEKALDKMQAGNYTGALRDYTEAIRLDATEPAYFLNRGLAHEKLKNYAAAYNDYTQALRLDEHFEKAWLNRGNVLMRQQLYKEAIEDYTSALLFNNQYALAYYNRAIAYQKLQQLNKACVDIRQAEAYGKHISSSLKAQLCK
jgi:tetratricopeptide (TPR) repeat protein